MTRALVLAGGGMRVAWQAGVVRALAEAGLVFDHVDGTSGGIANTAMLLSGVGPVEMGERWSSLDPKDFSSLLPVQEYLEGPWSLPALGDADGIVEKVFPHLGVDVERIRRSALPGTFNLVDFVTKECVAVPHEQVDAPLLAAGMSLPLAMPPLRRDGHVWTDAVWVKDANLTEALRRGADEVWLVWCIGNSPTWGDGPLEQYVHMIEMSANGALFAELEAARAAGREFVLHVVRPERPLPLDPEYVTGRISGATLVAMGYRDARAYLAGRQPGGVPKDATCTAMSPALPGVRFTERFAGEVDGGELRLDLTVELPLPAGGDRPSSARVVGSARHPAWQAPALVAEGRVVAAGTSLVTECVVCVDGRDVALRLRRDLTDDPGPDAWSDATTAECSLDGRAAGRLRMGAGAVARLLATMEPTGAAGLTARAEVLARVVQRGWRDALAATR